eukprot:TRINITY_DN3467_c0_g1_i1.p1 TRINITY_DN3467_c0_g1~~TRINITY_DN3467_c0_g1_i1.p1  ORF type:complete len:147 (+),score=9.39 TRINITY_DN3467_c0_g1_i1:93-533(+)
MDCLLVHDANAAATNAPLIPAAATPTATTPTRALVFSAAKPTTSSARTKRCMFGNSNIMAPLSSLSQKPFRSSSPFCCNFVNYSRAMFSQDAWRSPRYWQQLSMLSTIWLAAVRHSFVQRVSGFITQEIVDCSVLTQFSYDEVPQP